MRKDGDRTPHITQSNLPYLPWTSVAPFTTDVSALFASSVPSCQNQYAPTTGTGPLHKPTSLCTTISVLPTIPTFNYISV